jgi:hypothetical protein
VSGYHGSFRFGSPTISRRDVPLSLADRSTVLWTGIFAGAARTVDRAAGCNLFVAEFIIVTPETRNHIKDA